MILVVVRESWRHVRLVHVCDNIWDEFGESDDSIVPCSADVCGDQFSVLADRWKKARHEATGIEANNSRSHIYLTGEDSILEKSPWSRARNGDFPASCHVGSDKDVRNISSENSRMSNDGFNSGHIDSVDDDFCTGDPILDDSSAAANNGLYNYSLNNIPQTENNLSFFNSECDDKESNDLFYGWTDIGNFDDVDKMFRSCDSTFGLGSLSSEDDLYWFSSSQPREESKVALTSDSKLNKISESHEASFQRNEAPSTNGSKDVNDAAFGHLSMVNVSDTKSQEKNELLANEQANPLAKNLHKSEGKRRNTENGVFFHNSDNSNQIIVTKIQHGNLTSQYYPPSAFQQPSMTYKHLNYDQTSDQMSVCQTISGIKSENNVNPSSSSNESSYASNQAQLQESIHGSVIKALQYQDLKPTFASNIKTGNKPTMMVFSESVPVQNNEGQADVKGVEDIPAELDSKNAHESSCVSSELDDISLEATSLRQLQRVIEQLDIRTKLRIRDSLYRLAKSAEQRRSGIIPNGGNIEEKEATSQLATGETNTYTGFEDVETDTNPIDRSIAHLLFHRPSDSSVMPQNDTLSYKSHAMIPQASDSQSQMIEKREET